MGRNRFEDIPTWLFHIKLNWLYIHIPYRKVPEINKAFFIIALMTMLYNKEKRT